MVRLALMNLMMHGIDNPRVDYHDTLSKSFTEETEYAIVMANLSSSAPVESQTMLRAKPEAVSPLTAPLEQYAPGNQADSAGNQSCPIASRASLITGIRPSRALSKLNTKELIRESFRFSAL